MKLATEKLDGVRAKGFRLLDGLGGGLGARVRKLNDALGKPLASAAELADRRAFEAGYTQPAAKPAPVATTTAREAAPVIVYHLDKHRRDLPRFTQVLDAAEIPYRVMSLEGDEATLTAVRRDAGGRKLPLCFIAGECVGGREELTAMDRSGELKRRVYGA